MTIILTILKIIGWLLLLVFLLILGILLLVLFFPVGYHIRGSIHQKEKNGTVCIYWLLHLFSFCIRYDAGESCMYIRLFGIKKPLGTDARGKKTGSGNAVEGSYENDAPTSTADGEESRQTLPEDNLSGDHASTSSGKGTIFQRIRKKWKNFRKKLTDIRHNIRRIRRMINDSGNRRAAEVIRKEIVRLLKQLMPGRLFLDLSYSTGSPDTTAQVFGALALFPVGYRNRWNIQPDFEADEAYVEGEADVKGHFFIVCFVGSFIRVLADKSCRRLFRQFGNHKS